MHTFATANLRRRNLWVSGLIQAAQYHAATTALVESWLDAHIKNKSDNSALPCPRRTAIKLGSLGAHLSEIYISEWQGPNELIINTLGSKLIALLGSDLTGRNILSSVTDGHDERQLAYYKALQIYPCAGAVTRWGINHLNKLYVYQSFQLPLTDRHGRIKYFIGTGTNRSDATLTRAGVELPTYVVEQQEYNFFDIGFGIPDTLEPTHILQKSDNQQVVA